MRIETERKLTVKLFIDSSEAIMFEKGGYQKAELSPDVFKDVDKIEVLFQIDPQTRGRFDFITQEAKKHKATMPR
jgi:hypothetical protein